MERGGYRPDEAYPTKGDNMTDAERWTSQYDYPMPEGTYYDEKARCWIMRSHPEEGVSFSTS